MSEPMTDERTDDELVAIVGRRACELSIDANCLKEFSFLVSDLVARFQVQKAQLAAASKVCQLNEHALSCISRLEGDRGCDCEVGRALAAYQYLQTPEGKVRCVTNP